ncbi:V-type ATP synthase subunit I [Anaerocolumna cellulosilytica]|uniref:V-type ATP synthase subunit I n=1 Tax=Anaerocolumna cellulosilytica TaxID=433286 RepID=A0A6S6R0E0_9FIRM|nr:V-type ATP synthase subunit I [Anaerocolumna cellulosilytica]MBB5194007.1 V/A-type H+-transporting ATPase subunit I [Anaerocolumna cellulosilytica]BCJ94779.1 V-type ATP synthase subunit I [Anaerocolumna cellulosilytica]
MAVLQMQRICICALKENRKPILELLQRQGVIEICDIMPEDSVFKKSNVSVAENLLLKNVAAAKDALVVLDTYAPEKKSMLSSLNGRAEVMVQSYDTFTEKYSAVVHTVNRILALVKSVAENKAEIIKLESQAEMLSPWSTLDIPLNFNGTKSTGSFIGTLPGAWTLEMIYESLADLTPINVEIISDSKEQTCIFVLCTKDKLDFVSESLRAIGFSYPNSTVDKKTAEQLKNIETQINVLKKDITIAQEEIISYVKDRNDIRFLEDYETMRTEKYEVISHLLQSKKVFILTGYIPKVEAENITNLLNSKFELSIELEEPQEDEDVPVLLKNNSFSNPLEGTVEAFSPPGKGDIDPTFIMSLFYYLLFGLMLSDAGYGALMALGCAFALLKFRSRMEEGMKKTLRMYLFCGISTVFWGVMFGSYFGDLLDVVTENFFGNKITIPPLWFIPVNEPMRMLVFSMLLGIIHLFAGLIIKLYLCIKKKDIQGAVYDVIFWLVLLTSSIFMLLTTQMIGDIFSIRLELPAAVTSVLSWLAIISAAGIVLTNGRESKNPFKRFLKGAYALYGISGYLSDVLSYSRLLALGLATGVICNVINKMAGMASGGPVGIIFFILIVVVGHTMNLGINALGAYVHTNRLQYVEFFGKFYDGGGRMFKAFSAKTKYFKFKENTTNGNV